MLTAFNRFIKSSFTLRYVGSIGGQYHIRADLSCRPDGTVTGTYLYVKQKKPISLEGRLADGVLALSECAGEAKTGTFTCTQTEPG